MSKIIETINEAKLSTIRSIMQSRNEIVRLLQPCEKLDLSGTSKSIVCTNRTDVNAQVCRAGLIQKEGRVECPLGNGVLTEIVVLKPSAERG